MISELEGRITKFPVLPTNRWDHFCGESKSAECAEDEDAAVLDVVEPKPGDVKGQQKKKNLSLSSTALMKTYW